MIRTHTQREKEREKERRRMEKDTAVGGFASVMV